MENIYFVKNITGIVIFSVGLMASRKLSCKLFKGFGVLLVVRYLTLTLMTLFFLFLSNSLTNYSTLIFNELPNNVKLETSVEEIKRIVLTQEVASIMFNGVFVSIGLWLLWRYSKILLKLNTVPNNTQILTQQTKV